MRFSPQCVVFIAKTENESVPIRSVQIRLTPKAFRQCTFYARKCLKSQVFRTFSAPDCLNPLQKLQLVSCGLGTPKVTPYIAFSRSYMCVRWCFGCLFGQNSIFCHISGTKTALLSQLKARLLPSVPFASFLELCSCSLNTFRKGFLVPLSTSARNQEKRQKNAKKNVFSRKCLLFRRKTLRRVTLHLQ